MKRNSLALAVSLSIFPALVSAQMLEEVIVTAQKKEETLVEAPVAVTLISSEELTRFAVFQADELNKLTTGMEIRFEGDSRVGVGLRGVGTFQQQSAPSRVGVYMDDFYMASQQAFALGSMFDMGNVQILKGPQGTLYGQPSPTGALILGTQDPNFEGISGYVQGSYLADPVGYNVQAALNVPVIEDQLAFRIAVMTDDRETGTENINPVNSLDEERNRDGVRAKLLWEPSDTFQAKLGFTYMESNESEVYRVLETAKEGQPGFDATANFPNLRPDDRYAISDNPSAIDREQSLVTLHLGWQLGDVDVRWFSGAIDSKTAITQDNDRTDIASVVLAQEGHVGDDLGASQHELRVSGEAFDMWEWTVGAYYQETESRTDVDTFANRQENGGVFNIIIGIPLETEVKALFTHNSIALSEDTELTIGLRYNEFDQSDGTTLSGDFFLGSDMRPGGEITDAAFVFENVFPGAGGMGSCVPTGGVGTPPCLVGAGDFGWEEWTGTVKLSHRFSDELNTYVTLDRGFRPGAPNFDTTGVFQPDLIFYEGESVESIEFGFKGDVLDGRARYTAAIFYSVYEDYQAQAVGLTAFNLASGAEEIVSNAPFVNVDEAVQRGVEADFRVQVTEDWMIYTGFTYSQVEFTAGTVPCTDPNQPAVSATNRFNTCEADGEGASSQPELTVTFQTDYVFADSIMDSEAYVSGLWAYKGSTETPGDLVGRLDNEEYLTVDFFTGLRNDTWTAQLFVKNVFDDDGVISKRPLNFGYNEVIVTPPRTVGVTASYRF